MVLIHIFIAMLFRLYRYECEIFSKPFNGFCLTLWIGAKLILLVETRIPWEFKFNFLFQLIVRVDIKYLLGLVGRKLLGQVQINPYLTTFK